MKKILFTLLCLLLLGALTPAASAASFTDISGHYAEAEIEEARAKGWLNGYPDGSFQPNATVTQAEFTKWSKEKPMNLRFT